VSATVSVIAHMQDDSSVQVNEFPDPCGFTSVRIDTISVIVSTDKQAAALVDAALKARSALMRMRAEAGQ
jgi:hypothetical protein